MERILVIDGSPKGRKSITLKFVEYLQKMHPQTEFRFFHVAQDIRSYSQGPEAWRELLDALHQSQGVIWSFPVYLFMAPASLMRFVELIGEWGLQEAFAGKYSCCVCTSIHFYDNLALDHLRGALEDLGMRYTGFFSAVQEDFFKLERRKALELFYADFTAYQQQGWIPRRKFAPLPSAPALAYQPGPASAPVKLEGKKVAIVADLPAAGTNLAAMVRRLAGAFDGQVDVIDLSKLYIRGACLGCMKCAFDHNCTYADKDELKRVYETLLDPADIIVYAGALHGRYFSSTMKLLIERRFMRTHFPFMRGKQVALLVAGPLREASLLYDCFDADAQVSEAHFAGAESDEYPSSAALDAALDAFAARLARYAQEGYLPPDTFLGVGGRKVFRDEVWGRYRFLFQADHRYYKQIGFYDFPQKDWRMRLQNLRLMLLLRIPRNRRQVRNTLSGCMVKPLMDELENL